MWGEGSCVEDEDGVAGSLDVVGATHSLEKRKFRSAWHVAVTLWLNLHFPTAPQSHGGLHCTFS